MEEAAQENPPESSEFVPAIPAEEAFSEHLQQLEQASDAARARLQRRPAPDVRRRSFEDALSALPALLAEEALARFPRCFTINPRRVQQSKGDADEGFPLSHAPSHFRFRPVARILDTHPSKLAVVAVAPQQPPVVRQEQLELEPVSAASVPVSVARHPSSPPPPQQPVSPSPSVARRKAKTQQQLPNIRELLEAKLDQRALRDQQALQRLQRAQEAQLQRVGEAHQRALQAAAAATKHPAGQPAALAALQLRQHEEAERLQRKQASERAALQLRQERSHEQLRAKHAIVSRPPFTHKQLNGGGGASSAAPPLQTTRATVLEIGQDAPCSGSADIEKSTRPWARIVRAGDERSSGEEGGTPENGFKFEVKEPLGLVKEEPVDEFDEPMGEINEEGIKKEDIDTWC